MFSMNYIFSATLYLALSFLVATNCWGYGDLTLITKTELGKTKIHLIEEEGHLFGEILEGIAVVTPVGVVFSSQQFTISIGDRDYRIERLKRGQFVNYGGKIQDERGISAQAKIDGHKMLISGTIEGEMNELIDFEIRANNSNGTFKLNWNENLLFLEKTPKVKTGSCAGGLTKKGSDWLVKFVCTSSGSLQDAFFRDPDQIMAWIVVLFVQ
jgi:hypothetical protein